MTFQPLLAWELARKDWKLFLADRQAVLLCFLVPIVLASAFGAIFHGSGNALPRLPLAVVLEDDSPISNGVVQSLKDNPEINLHLLPRPEALRWLARNANGAVVILPEGFDRTTAEKPAVEVYAHPGSEYLGRWAEGVLTESYLKKAAQHWLGSSATLERPFRVSHNCLPGTDGLGINSYSHSFCGMTLQYLFFWGMDSGLLLLRERRRGLWRRVRAAPVGLNTLLASKVLSTGAIALLQIAVTFGFGMAVFGVRVNGSVAGFALLALGAALLSATTGLLVAAVGGSEARARSLAIVAILALSLLGGLWLPFGFLPEWTQRLALGLPTTWASRGLEGVTWRGMPLSGAWPCALALLGFSLLFLLVALWRLRCAEDRLLSRGET